MPSTYLDSSVFRDIFTTPAMRAVWSDENRVQKYLDFEAALAREAAVVRADLPLAEARRQLVRDALDEGARMDEDERRHAVVLRGLAGA